MSNNYTPEYQKPNHPFSNEEGGEKPFYDNAPAIVVQPPSYSPPPQNYYSSPQDNSQNYPVQAFPVNQNYYPPQNQNQNIYYQPYVNVNNNQNSSPLIPAERPAPQNSVTIVILNFVLIGISIIDIILQQIFEENSINLSIDIINLICSILIIILYYSKVNLKHPCVGSLFVFLLIIFFIMGGLGLGLGLGGELDDEDEEEDDDFGAAFFVSLFTGIFFLIGRAIILFFLIPLTCNFRNPNNRMV